MNVLKKICGNKPFTVYRHTRNAIIEPFLTKPDLSTGVFKEGMRFWDHKSYEKALAYYLAKHQSFEEYIADAKNEPKDYIDLDFSAYFQCYQNIHATSEALRSFRQFYPNIPLLLVSDGGKDFGNVARQFDCQYHHDKKNIGYWPCLDMLRWFERLARACISFNTEWVLILEDDVRTRDRISKYPNAHLAGQGGSRGTKVTKQLSPLAQAAIKEKFPATNLFGISGCGGSIFHRTSFLRCFRNLNINGIETWPTDDAGLHGATDIALTFLFLINGYIVRRWLDLSHDTVGNWGPASAFDHQYKAFYK